MTRHIALILILVIPLLLVALFYLGIVSKFNFTPVISRGVIREDELIIIRLIMHRNLIKEGDVFIIGGEDISLYSGYIRILFQTDSILIRVGDLKISFRRDDLVNGVAVYNTTVNNYPLKAVAGIVENTTLSSFLNITECISINCSFMNLTAYISPTLQKFNGQNICYRYWYSMLIFSQINRTYIALPLSDNINGTKVVVYVNVRPNFNLIPEKLRFPTKGEDILEIVILRDLRGTLIIFYSEDFLEEEFLEKPYKEETRLILSILENNKIVRNMLNSNCTIEKIGVSRFGYKLHSAYVYISCRELENYRIIVVVNPKSSNIDRIILTPRG
ncbi:MAG: hypothetical protein DRJ32_02500 [Thermoprotei archaeon]|nr:MAG: hypothetical protein DRJ32_02500 [Thermoprotei archaeon]